MAMQSTGVVPVEIATELTQILSNLVLGDNEIRKSAEKVVNDRLDHTPELYLLALAQFSTTADTEVMRSFSLVLLRRLLFRPSSHQHSKTTRITLYDHLSTQSLSTLERLLLHSLQNEPSQSVRRKSVDTVCDLANNSMGRGRPWHALQAQAFAMAQSDVPLSREAAYRVFAGCPNLVLDLRIETVLAAFQKGLQDNSSVDVRHAALQASVAYLTSSEPAQLAHAISLLSPMLDTLPHLAPSHLPTFLSTLTPLCTSHPSLFQQHLAALLSFLPPLILPTADPGPTPTVARPFPSNDSRAFSFSFPPPKHLAVDKATQGHGEEQESGAYEEENDLKDRVRKAALEFMVSLSEAKPSMVKKQDGWISALVRACLECMGELPEDQSALELWLEADPSDDPTDETYPYVYEQSLDRLACALGGKSVLPPAFQYIPSMLASYDWRLRHAGLMAIAAIGEGTSKVMQHELGKVVNLVTPMFSDSNPRVRYAACQCVGQLCTDMEELIQERYHQQLFAALIPTLEAPEPRVHSHAAAALINFCEGVERDTLIPYLDPIVERLLKLLSPAGPHAGVPGADEDRRRVKRYVQEQAITTLAMVADASEATFAKHYPSIMPLLLNILTNAAGPEYRKLRVKAMECAGLIAIAVGRDIFRNDANTLIELLMQIQNNPVDPGDTLLAHYLIATWAKICQALGQEFEPYLPVVMPPLLAAASAKADVSLFSEDDEKGEEREGWETISMDGQLIGIRTSAIEEKCQAFETLVIYTSTLGSRFAPYLAQTLEIALPSMQFHFHDGVREACAMLIPTLFGCGKNSGTLTTQMVAATFLQLIQCIGTENDASFLASLYKCFTDCLRTLGGPAVLSADFHRGVVEATKRQLQLLAERRKERAQRPVADLEDEREDLALLEEMEDFALEDMAKTLQFFDPAHPLLIAVSSVKDLGFNHWNSEDDDEDGEEG